VNFNSKAEFLNMSVVNAAKRENAEVQDLVRDFVMNGGKISVGKSKRKLPKYLRYNGATANGKNHAPTFNPLKHAV
jgi:hypothetical protein